MYKDNYPEMNVPVPQINANPVPDMSMGERTLALMQGKPYEQKRNAEGVPIDSQQESNDNFDFAMFEKAVCGTTNKAI